MEDLKKPQPIVLIGATYVMKGCDPDKVADITYEALKANKNVAEELAKVFGKF